jgi:YbbR domain-containing protein
LELEKSARRTVPIVPVTDGDPAPGFVVGRITSDPAMVDIEGPESHVKQVGEATTEPVEVNGRKERTTDIVAIGVTDSSVRLVKPQSANVTVEITPAPVERDVAGVPVRWRNLSQGLAAPRVAPNVARVTIRGQRDTLAAIRPDAIEAFVDVTGLGPGTYTLRVQVDPSQSFGVGSVTPSVVAVTIR